MTKTDIIFESIARQIGMERQSAELRTLLDLYVAAVLEEQAGESVEPAWLDKSPVPEPLPEVEEAVLEPEQFMPPTEERPENAEVYKGFLHIRCVHCGEIKSFFSKYPLQYFRCAHCEEKTVLQDLRKVWLKCECGNFSTYHTNLTDWGFDVSCVRCGAPVAVEYRGGVHAYVTSGKYSPRGRKKRR